MSANDSEFTECYIYRSTNGINWKRESGDPFPPSEARIRAEAENEKVKEIQKAHRRPDGSFYGTYVFVVRAYRLGEEVPQELEEDLRRLYGIYW